jgi:glycosyltransferase involved in cell wall biosynthesis
MTNSIALNARFAVHRPSGMQRYGIELAHRLRDHLHMLRPAQALRGPAGHLWEQFYLPSATRGRLLWSPNNTGPLAVSRQVCTLHDLIPLDHPEWFSRRFAAWYQWLLPRLAKQVRHIIAVSEFTKQRAVELLRVPPEKVTVILHGVDERFKPQAEESVQEMRRVLGIESPAYLLYVGNLEPRKNLRRLIRAWEIAQRSVPEEIELVVAGAKGSSLVFEQVALGAVPPRVRFTGYVPDQHLPALYAGSLALVYPSLYEGFGLPPLEAMACGTLVVTSSNTSLPEVVGDAATLVDAKDVHSIADGILRGVSNNGRRAEIQQGGFERVKHFTWESTAAQTLRVLLEQGQN